MRNLIDAKSSLVAAEDIRLCQTETNFLATSCFFGLVQGSGKVGLTRPFLIILLRDFRRKLGMKSLFDLIFVKQIKYGISVVLVVDHGGAT